MPTYNKDPDATLNYTFDWSRWLESGETIASAAFTVESGLTKGAESNTTTTAQVTLSGGTAGETYDVTCRITTNAAQIDDRTIQIAVSEQ